MKTLSLISSAVFVFSLAFTNSFAQSNTTEGLQKNYHSRPFFFYNNTLRMINQKEDKAFDELIKDIEKMKLLLIDKPGGFASADYKKIVSDYKKEAFEEAMTSRFEGKTLDIFLKGKDKKVKGVLVLVNDKETLYVLDIVGSIALDKIGSLYKTIESSSDIEEVLKGFSKKHDGKGDDKKDDNKDDNDN